MDKETKLSSGSDCNHNAYYVVMSGHGVGSEEMQTRELVTVCADCGLITVTASKGGQTTVVSFWVVTAEVMDSIGNYRKIVGLVEND